MSNVLIDTSSIYCASLADYDTVSQLEMINTTLVASDVSNINSFSMASQNKLCYKNKRVYERTKRRTIALGFWNLLESVVLYDQIYVDGTSIAESKEALNIIQLFEGIVSLVNSRDHHSTVHLHTLDQFEKYKFAGECIHLEDGFGLNVVLGHLEADLDRLMFEWHSSRSSRDSTIVRTQDGDATMIAHILGKLLSTPFHFADPHLQQVNQQSTHIGNEYLAKEMAKVYLNVYRCLYYYNLSCSLKVNYIPHPLRQNAWKTGQHYPIFEKDLIGCFDDNVRKSLLEKTSNVFQSINIMNLQIPILPRYILRGMRTIDDIINRTLEIRQSKEARKFREFCSKLEEAYKEGRLNELDKARKRVETLASQWRGEKKDTEQSTFMVKDPFGVVSGKIRIPDTVLHHLRSRGPLLFSHQLTTSI